MFKIKKKYLVIAIMVLVFIFGGLKIAKVGPFKAKPAPVQTEEVVVSPNVNVSGKVQAKNNVNLSFQSSGLLSWVGVKEGDHVRKFQAIASLDKRDLQKRLQKTLNLYMTNRWDFNQLSDDNKDKALTDSLQRILDKSQFSLDNSVIDVELIDLAKQLATISTPIEGIVTKVDAPFAGVNVTGFTPLFTVVDPKSTYFEATVDESDIAKIKIAQDVKISLDSFQDQTFEGKITSIDFMASPTAGGGTAFRVEISLPENLDQRFRVGMNGDAEIII